jgi:hypothetical protein
MKILATEIYYYASVPNGHLITINCPAFSVKASLNNKVGQRAYKLKMYQIKVGEFQQIRLGAKSNDLS